MEEKRLISKDDDQYIGKPSELVKLVITPEEVQRRIDDEEYNKQCPNWNNRMKIVSKYGYVYDRYITGNGDIWIVDYDDSIVDNAPNFTFPNLKRILGCTPSKPEYVLIAFNLMDGEIYEIANSDIDRYLCDGRYEVLEALKY